MKKRHTAKQEKILEDIKKTYLAVENVTAKDLAVIRNSKDFTEVNKSRHCRHAVEHAINQFKITDELIRKLPPSYSTRILSSHEFKRFLRSISETATLEVPILNEKSREVILSEAVLMFQFSLSTIIKSMPNEFKTSLIESITPFSNLVFGISNFVKHTGGDEIFNSDLSFLHPDKLRKLPPRK